jgi:hypothetical protein
LPPANATVPGCMSRPPGVGSPAGAGARIGYAPNIAALDAVRSPSREESTLRSGGRHAPPHPNSGARLPPQTWWFGHAARCGTGSGPCFGTPMRRMCSSSDAAPPGRGLSPAGQSRRSTADGAEIRQRIAQVQVYLGVLAPRACSSCGTSRRRGSLRARAQEFPARRGAPVHAAAYAAARPRTWGVVYPHGCGDGARWDPGTRSSSSPGRGPDPQPEEGSCRSSSIRLPKEGRPGSTR